MNKKVVKKIIDKIIPIIEEEAKKEYMASKDVLYAIAGIYSLEIERLARNCQSKEDIDQQEK